MKAFSLAIIFFICVALTSCNKTDKQDTKTKSPDTVVIKKDTAIKRTDTAGYHK